MQTLKSGKTTKIKQKLTKTFTTQDLQIENNTKSNIKFEVHEVPDGKRQKVLIKIKRLERKVKKKTKNIYKRKRNK